MMFNTEQQQCLLAALGLYTLRRRDGTLAIDGLPGPSTKRAILTFQQRYKHRSEFIDLDVDGLWGPETEKAVREVIGNNEASQVEETSSNVQPPEWWSKYPDVPWDHWRCRCNGRFCNGYPAMPHEKTVAMLQAFVDHFHTPILWNSGLRCDRYNASIPGASPKSRHRLGEAFDFHMAGVTPQQLAAFGETLIPNSGGIGIYSWGIHIDDRAVKSRWYG